MSTPLDYPKRRGEWVELQFAARAAAHGLNVSKPWGDSCRYDFVVERNRRFYRVQVKSTTHSRRDAFLVNFGGCYTPEDVDVIAIYILPLDLWYLLPVTVVLRKRGVMLSPGRAANPYRDFLEAWHLLVSPAPARSRVASASKSQHTHSSLKRQAANARRGRLPAPV